MVSNIHFVSKPCTHCNQHADNTVVLQGTSQSKDVDACIRHPCRDGAGSATCQDLPNPAPNAAAGRRCTCDAGYSYKGETRRCTCKRLEFKRLAPQLELPAPCSCDV
jgi:hypothetical protein